MTSHLLVSNFVSRRKTKQKAKKKTEKVIIWCGNSLGCNDIDCLRESIRIGVD
jgi:hypothetical protein